MWIHLDCPRLLRALYSGDLDPLEDSESLHCQNEGSLSRVIDIPGADSGAAPFWINNVTGETGKHLPSLGRQ